MARRDKRGGAGCKPGAPNTPGAASDLMPLDYLLAVLRNESVEPRTRFEAAKAAAPYVHPRLCPIVKESDTKDDLASWLWAQCQGTAVRPVNDDGTPADEPGSRYYRGPVKSLAIDPKPR